MRVHAGSRSASTADIKPSWTAWTLSTHSKLPLSIWFLAVYLLAEPKNSTSAEELMCHLEVSYPTARSLKHKLLLVMLERDARRKLCGIVQPDDVYWGGERRGQKPGRGALTRVPFTAAAATNQGRHLVALRMSRSSGFYKAQLRACAEKLVDPAAMVLTEVPACFRGIVAAGLEGSRWPPAADQPASSCPGFPGSTPSAAMSRAPCTAATTTPAANICYVTSPSHATASTAASTLPPCPCA